MGCCRGGLFRIFDYINDYGGCGRGGYYHDSHYEFDRFNEMIIAIDRLYAEGKIDTDIYTKLKKDAADGNLTIDDLMRVQMNSHKASNQEHNETDSQLKKYYDKINQIDKAKEESVKIKNELLTQIEELKRKAENLEKAAETMLSADETSAKDYLKEKIDIDSKISTLEKRKQDLEKDISDMDEIKNELNIKILELKSLKQREKLNDLKVNINE